MDSSFSEHESAEEKLYEFFDGRYKHLLKLRRNVGNVYWKKVIKEMNQTLEEYKTKSMAANIECIKVNRQLLPSGKTAVNCVSVVSSMFCEKLRDLEIEVDISFITNEAHLNIESLLPFIGRGVLPLRMVEIMLYVMCTICEEYKDNDRKWSSAALKCFNHRLASNEVKLASAVLLCNFDRKEGERFVTFEIYVFLQKTLLNDEFLGFREKDVKWAIYCIQDNFDTNTKIKALQTEPRDSGYKTDEGNKENEEELDGSKQSEPKFRIAKELDGSKQSEPKFSKAKSNKLKNSSDSQHFDTKETLFKSVVDNSITHIILAFLLAMIVMYMLQKLQII